MSEDQKKHCFVIGPIGDEGSAERTHADWLLDMIIAPVFERDLKDWTVERADKIPTPGMVSSQITNRLHEAELVIADLSFHNANAFYEMSIRHNVGRPIIHMIKKGERIPFDVIPHRAILFSLAHPDDIKRAREQLSAAIGEATKPGFEPDNPITHARGKLELERNASPEMKVIAEELAALRAKVDRIEIAETIRAREALASALTPTPWTDRLVAALGAAPPDPSGKGILSLAMAELGKPKKLFEE